MRYETLYLENYIKENARSLDPAQQINFLSTLKCNFRWLVHRWSSGQLVRGLKSRATERKINICGEKRGAGGANSTVKIRDHRTPLAGLSVTYNLPTGIFAPPVPKIQAVTVASGRARGQRQFPSFIVPFARFLSPLVLHMFFQDRFVKKPGSFSYKKNL